MPGAGHGFSRLPRLSDPGGATWDQYGDGPVDYPGRMGGVMRNPTSMLWLLAAAGLAYLAWKRPNLPGKFDEAYYDLLPPGTPVATGAPTGGVAAGQESEPGIENVCIKAA